MTAAIALPVPTDPPPPDGVLRYLGFDGCVRLPIRVDPERLASELASLPAETWGGAGRDPVVQAAVESFFVIGQPRGRKPKPADDQPALGALPYLRRFLRETIPAVPTRAIVARLVPHGLIPIHTDTPRFFRGTVRLSIQVAADGAQRLYCNGRWYELAPGEVWAIDNLRPHGVYNSADGPRINVLADYRPSDELARLIAAGEPSMGASDAAAREQIESLTRERYRASRWRSIRYELSKLLRRRGAGRA